jgi:D-glycero-alpha-D-manno-heptose-7-phosphate kinase
MSLAGGGTDLPTYYERHGGLVVSATLNKYFYVMVALGRPDSVQISSSDYRAFSRHRAGEQPLWDGDLGLVKAALHEFGIDRGISIFLASEVPPGTGLGSSSTVAVALVKTLATLQDITLEPGEVAELACTLELERLRSPIGKQDQYAAAFGGLNAITFDAARVTVEPMLLPADTRQRLERNLLLFFTGATRKSNAILDEQRRASADDTSDAVAALHAIKQAAAEIRHCLQHGDLRRFGEILAESWEQKKKLARGVSNPRIDELYDLALRYGASGGKLAGAGGGGFLMFYCDEPWQEAVTRALERAGLVRMDFALEHGGAQVLVNALPRTLSWASTHSSREVAWTAG